MLCLLNEEFLELDTNNKPLTIFCGQIVMFYTSVGSPWDKQNAILTLSSVIRLNTCIESSPLLCGMRISYRIIC
jgi:hypothetical protein